MAEAEGIKCCEAVWRRLRQKPKLRRGPKLSRLSRHSCAQEVANRVPICFVAKAPPAVESGASPRREEELSAPSLEVTLIFLMQRNSKIQKRSRKPRS